MQTLAFPDQSRYVAIGDSITHNGWYLPYVDLYYLTRFPNRNLYAFNCGINGDTADGAAKRYEWDIAPHQPSVASVMFAMNDVGRDFYEIGKEGFEVQKQRLDRLDHYERNLRNLVHVLQKDKIQVIVILPTIFDDTAVGASPHYPGLDRALGECAARAQKVADETGCPVIDFYHPMLKVTLEQQARDPAFSLIEPDRTHPSMRGQLFMAYLFLKTQNVPAEIARVSINAAGGVIRESVNCQVDGVSMADGVLTFRYLAKALPFPLDPIKEWTDATTSWLPFADDLNREIFQIQDLPVGNYQLAMDFQPIRTFTAAELALGVNLAMEENTPQARQAQKVWGAYKKRQELVFKLRTIACVERAAFTPEAPRFATMEEMEPLLAAHIKREVGTPWEKAIIEEVAAYRACKSEEANMRLAVDSMLESICSLAQPKPHEIKLSLQA
jgi:endoglucanase